MPTISMFRGIKVYINWHDHLPPHFHAKYGNNEVIVSINDIEVIEGTMPNKQLKMLLGWGSVSSRRTQRKLGTCSTTSRIIYNRTT